jgi:maltose O-acetyltransferase
MIRRLKYVWFCLCMRATAVLPDLVPSMRLRGWLVRRCFKRCGRNLQLGSGVMILHTTSVAIGDDVYIAHGAWIQGMGGITLEDEVMLAPYTVIASRNHTKKNGSYRFGEGLTKPVHVGRGAWLGAHVVVTAGVKIGAGAACAAGAVVTKDVPPDTMVGGVPARLIQSSADVRGTIYRSASSSVSDQ